MSGPPNGLGPGGWRTPPGSRRGPGAPRRRSRCRRRRPPRSARGRRDVDGVGVDRWIADRRVRVHVALERPDVGDLPDLPVVLDQQQSAEEIRDRVLRGQGVPRDRRAGRVLGFRRPAIGDEDLVRTEHRDAVRADGVGVVRRVGVRGEALDDPRLLAPPVDLRHCARGAHARGTLTADEARPAATPAGLRHEQVPARPERQMPRAVEPGRHDVHAGRCSRGVLTPSARSNTMGRMRSARMTPPPGGYRCGDTLHSRSTGQPWPIHLRAAL